MYRDWYQMSSCPNPQGAIRLPLLHLSPCMSKETELCRWLSDKSGPVSVMLVGLLISVIPFGLLGPSPFLAALFARAHLSGTWHVWVSLVLLGAGCAMCLMPVLPALLAAAEKVCIIEDALQLEIRPEAVERLQTTVKFVYIILQSIQKL